MQPIYFQLYDILHQYIYGLETVLTPDMTLTLTLMSSIGCVFCMALPFILIFGACKRWL